MTETYSLTIYDETPLSTETFEALPENITTESAENGERILVHDDSPDDIRLEVFVPEGTAYTLRKEV
ncbi:hypothetical protein [Natrinema salifodinae]|nr:hypothetical protein [Natrinema salifodinae]